LLLDEVRREDVKDAQTFSKFCQQNFGVPYATAKDLAILKRNAKVLFAEHPNLDWQSMVQVAYWCHAKKRKIARTYYYINQFRWAYADGAITLESHSVEATEVDERMRLALLEETNTAWRARLSRADGSAAKREVLQQWEEMRQQS
jgi:hypothetical protein